MTREEFTNVLDNYGYSYEIEGDRIIVTYRGSVFLESLTSLPPGVVFKNGGDVGLKSIGEWFEYWKGNIEGIESNRLLNVMIKQRVFER